MPPKIQIKTPQSRQWNALSFLKGFIKRIGYTIHPVRGRFFIRVHFHCKLLYKFFFCKGFAQGCFAPLGPAESNSFLAKPYSNLFIKRCRSPSIMEYWGICLAHRTVTPSLIQKPINAALFKICFALLQKFFCFFSAIFLNHFTPHGRIHEN